MATASPFDATLRDVLGSLLAATRELQQGQTSDEVGQIASELALRLTGSAYAHIQLDDRSFSSGRMPAGTGASLTAELRGQDQALGSITVRRPVEYTNNERVAFEVFASHLALALVATAPRDQTAERLRRVERAHEHAVAVLQSVSSHAAQGHDLSGFYRRMAVSVGEHVGANRVLFWRLGEDQTLRPVVPGGYHIDQAILGRLKPTPCRPGGDNLASRVVFDDYVFRASRVDAPSDDVQVLEALGMNSAISVPWRAGEERLGMVSAYDSTRPGGFSREDTWVLEKAGLAAGLVTRLWQSDDDLRRSGERLSRVDSARQMLLKNMTSVVEKERKRLVNELHDDALQKLTAAEIQLARLEAGADDESASLEGVRALLVATEAALRRLVFEVRPPSLESPNGLAQSVRERVAMLEAKGVATEVTADLPPELSADLRTMVFRQIAEAIGNVERHAQATRVQVTLKVVEGGVLGIVQDDGQGFVVAERSNLPGHLGLLALRERALMAGGRYQIDSRPGAGTRVEFWIPLDQ